MVFPIQYEHKKIFELLELLDHAFVHHKHEREKSREILNLLNLSIRGLLLHLDYTKNTQEIDEQFKELKSRISEYLNHATSDSYFRNVVKQFLEVLTEYYLFVDKDHQSTTDICNVFRIITDAYMIVDPEDEEHVEDVRIGLRGIVEEWLAGRISPPKSEEELSDEELQNQLEQSLK